MKSAFLLPMFSLVLAACGADTSVDDDPPASRADSTPIVVPQTNGPAAPTTFESTTDELASPDVDTEEPRAKGPSLVLTVENLRSQSGKLCYSIFDEAHASAFGRNDVAESDVSAAACVDVSATPLVITVSDLAPGTFAIALFHDENSNGILDKAGVLGIPTEGFGFSRNPPLRIGAPDFAECAFSIPATGAEETVKLQRVF